MVVDHALLAHLFAVSANVITACKILHHALLFFTAHVLLAVMMVQIALRLKFGRATWTFEIAFLTMCVCHMLQIVASRAETFVTFDANKSLLHVLVDIVHTHRRRFFVMTMVTAFWTVNVCAHLLVPLVFGNVSRAGISRFNCVHRMDLFCEHKVKI